MYIKHKLIASIAITLIGLVVLAVMIAVETNQLEDISKTALEAEQLQTNMLKLRRSEKDFLSRNDLKYKARFLEDYAITEQSINYLAQYYKDHSLDATGINNTMTAMRSYKEQFVALTALKEELGLTPKTGLYGSLRQAAHGAEQSFKDTSDYKALADYLMLRRFEKDFMLRQDMKYVDRFNKLIDTMVADSSGTTKQNLTTYKKDFNAFVVGIEKMGLTAYDGLIGKLRTTIHQADESLEHLEKEVGAYIVAETASTKTQAYIIVSVISFIIVALNIYLSNSIIKPLMKLDTAIREINQTKDLSKRANINSKDEIGSVANNFDNMLANFQRLIQEVNVAVDTLSSAAEELSHNASETQSGIDNQLQETEMVATAVTEMGSTIEEIASNTEAAASKAEATNTNAIDGRESVEQTLSKINTLADKLTDSAAAVSDLEDESQTIGQVLDVIKGIAEQTNLLALNAAIEAARAGEQGRGFAVVADEVRNLAMRTQESTQEITKIIDSLQGRTATIVDLINICHNQGQESSEQAQQAGALLEQITSDVTNISDTSIQVAAAIEEQSSVANEVNRNIVNIRDIAETSNQAAQHTSQASDEILHQAQNLSQSVQQFKV